MRPFSDVETRLDFTFGHFVFVAALPSTHAS